MVLSLCHRGSQCHNAGITMTSSHTDLSTSVPEKSGCGFNNGIFNLVLLIGIFRSSLRWIPRDLTDDKSTLVQEMAWCRQATSHYLGHFFLPRSMSPYNDTWPQKIFVARVPLWYRHFGDVFKYIFFNEIWIWDKISLKYNCNNLTWTITNTHYLWR